MFHTQSTLLIIFLFYNNDLLWLRRLIWPGTACVTFNSGSSIIRIKIALLISLLSLIVVLWFSTYTLVSREEVIGGLEEIFPSIHPFRSTHLKTFYTTAYQYLLQTLNGGSMCKANKPNVRVTWMQFN